jgi:hypothetical protein
MNKIKIIIIFFLLYGCSYTPILTQKNYNFSFQSISTSGEKYINEIIKSDLSNRGLGDIKYDIYFSTSKDKEVVSSNTKGDPTIFRLNVSLLYEVSQNNEIKFENEIIKQITYNNIEDKYELTKYEESILKIISQNLAGEIMMNIASK